jgi:hypothetical protein
VKRFIAITVIFVATPASAQTLNPVRLDDARHVLSAGVGVDGAATGELAYTAVFERRFAVTFRLSMPLRPSLADFGVSGGLFTGWVRDDGLGVAGRIELGARREETHYADFTRISAAFAVLGGYFRERGSAALELAYEPGLLTHVRPTDAYRSQVYDAAHSTWMAGGNGFLRVGVQGVLRIVDDTEISLRAGMARTDHFRPLDFLPFYALLGVNQGF